MTPETEQNRARERAIGSLAAKQHGIVGRKQLLELGATASLIQRRVTSGRWQQLSAGVYRLNGSTHCWEQDLFAAVLSHGENAVASHRSAAALYRLDQYRKADAIVTAQTRRAGLGKAYRNQLHPAEKARVGVIPVTTPARTLLDLAATESFERLQEVLDEAVVRGLVTKDSLERVLARSKKGRPGVNALRRAMAERDEGPVPMSLFETKLLAALKKGGAPKPKLQWRVEDGGKLIGIVDFAYPGVKLAIEADGYRWHSGKADWERDRTRRNRLTLAGWRVINVTWRQLKEHPEQVVATIMEALKQ